MRRPEYERMTPFHTLTSLGETHDLWILDSNTRAPKALLRRNGIS
jgi:hypothetical protein